MYLVSLQGQGTSFSPAASGAPTEWSAGTKSASSSSILFSTTVPHRAMTRMDTATYAESVISTPNLGSSALRRPMTKGMTYIVRPAIEPRYRCLITVFISAGAIQLLVGPASFSLTEQMKVRSSTRATSEGLEAQWKELGLMSSLRRVKVPAET